MSDQISFYSTPPRPRERVGIDEELTAHLQRRIVGLLGRGATMDEAADRLRVDVIRLLRWVDVLGITNED